MDKLEVYGIKGKSKKLLKSYLTGRYQKVMIARGTLNSNSSEWEQIKSGVPQGSILGPLLFLLYINDFPSVIPNPNCVVLFADDTIVLTTDSDIQNLNIMANQLFSDVNLWFNSNLLTLNYKKTHYVEYKTNNYYQTRTNINYEGYYQTRTNINYEGNTIPNLTSTKFLGLIVDETLSWNEHIDSAAKKLCSASYIVRNLKHSVSPTTMKTLYYAYIHPIISHGIIFWGRASKVTKLFTLQKRIVKIITDKKPRDSCRDAFRNMKILTLFSQYLFSLIVFTVENDYHFNLNKDIH